MRPGAPPPFVDVRVVETFAELLFAVHTDGDSAVFFDRLCEATCTLADMDRAAVFVYDEAQRRVRVAGSHGIEVDAFRDWHVDLDSAPMAVHALDEDRVLEATDGFDALVPAEAEPYVMGTRLVCTPVSAAGRWPGVIFSDRPVDRPLSDAERHLLWSFGKLAALADGARAATREHERAKQLQERIDLAREIHDGVIQRLFGVSLALSGERLSDAERRRCGAEVQEALGELREALQRPLGRAPRATQTTLVEEVRRLAARLEGPAIEYVERPGAGVPAHLEALAQSVMVEALRNALKHADPTVVRVCVDRLDGAWVLDVVNDGVPARARHAAGMGLRLAAVEALQHGGVVEFGRVGNVEWRVRLLVPAEDAA
jgi:signal transduction histidine kinase